MADLSDWRHADVEWRIRRKGMAGSTPAAAEKLFIPRRAFVNKDETYKLGQFQSVSFNISQQPIAFEPGSAALTSMAISVLKDIADALLEYPELLVKVEAFSGLRDRYLIGEDEAPLTKLSQERAKVVRESFVERGINHIIEFRGFGMDEGQKDGKVKLVPVRNEVYPLVHDAQARLDMILQRCTFEFAPKTKMLSFRGSQCVEMCVRVLKETSRACFLVLPMNSSKMALERAEVITEACHKHGLTNRLDIQIAKDDRRGASLVLEEDPKEVAEEVEEAEEIFDEVIDFDLPSEDVESTQAAVNEVLKQTPLLFSKTDVDVVTDCAPILDRISALMQALEKTNCRIEVYSGALKPGESVVVTDETNKQDLAARRARQLAKRLQERGVRTPFRCVGFSYPKLKGGGPRAPHAELVLIDAASIVAGEEELEDGGWGDFVQCGRWYTGGCVPVRQKPEGVQV